MWKFYQAVRHSASSSNNRGINHFSHTLHTQISDKKDIEWRRESKRETLARCISRQAAHHMRSCTLTLCSHLYKRSFSLIASRSTLLRMRRGQAIGARDSYISADGEKGPHVARGLKLWIPSCPVLQSRDSSRRCTCSFMWTFIFHFLCEFQ